MLGKRDSAVRLALKVEKSLSFIMVEGLVLDLIRDKNNHYEKEDMQWSKNMKQIVVWRSRA